MAKLYSAIAVARHTYPAGLHNQVHRAAIAFSGIMAADKRVNKQNVDFERLNGFNDGVDDGFLGDVVFDETVEADLNGSWWGCRGGRPSEVIDRDAGDDGGDDSAGPGEESSELGLVVGHNVSPATGYLRRVAGRLI